MPQAIYQQRLQGLNHDRDISIGCLLSGGEAIDQYPVVTSNESTDDAMAQPAAEACCYKCSCQADTAYWLSKALLNSPATDAPPLSIHLRDLLASLRCSPLSCHSAHQSKAAPAQGAHHQRCSCITGLRCTMPPCSSVAAPHHSHCVLWLRTLSTPPPIGSPVAVNAMVTFWRPRHSAPHGDPADVVACAHHRAPATAAAPAATPSIAALLPQRRWTP